MEAARKRQHAWRRKNPYAVSEETRSAFLNDLAARERARSRAAAEAERRRAERQAALDYRAFLEERARDRFLAWGLRCASLPEVAWWLDQALRANDYYETKGEKVMHLFVFCRDADPADCADHRAAGRCVNPHFALWRDDDEEEGEGECPQTVLPVLSS